MMKTEAIVCRPAWRLLTAALAVASRGSLLAIIALLLFLDEWLGLGFRLGNPVRLLRAFAGFCLAPAMAARLLERAFAATVSIEHGAVVVERRASRTEIPLDAVDGVERAPALVPPVALRLRLRSGSRFPQVFQLADPLAFLGALGDAGAPERVRAVSRDPLVVYTRSLRPGRWYHPVLKFVVFALVPALPLFRLHQWIAYGGTFGEYYAYGLQPYLLGLAIYWAMSITHLVLYAALLRAVVEPIVLVTAYVAPARTDTARRIGETTLRALYYGGVPLYLVRLFFFPS